MRLKTFSLVVGSDGQLDDSEMVSGLDGCEVLHVWERFLEEERVWLIMVGYRSNHLRESNRQSAREQRIEERWRAREKLMESLDPLEQKVFESLRAWRAATATIKQIGPHFIFTNNQLAEVVKRNPSTIGELRQIHGIGKGKAEEFGEPLFEPPQNFRTAPKSTILSIRRAHTCPRGARGSRRVFFRNPL